jgi:hypothetical protein
MPCEGNFVNYRGAFVNCGVGDTGVESGLYMVVAGFQPTFQTGWKPATTERMP